MCEKEQTSSYADYEVDRDFLAHKRYDAYVVHIPVYDLPLPSNQRRCHDATILTDDYQMYLPICLPLRSISFFFFNRNQSADFPTVRYLGKYLLNPHARILICIWCYLQW